MIEIDLACNKIKDLKKQSNDRHVAKWNGVKVPFFLQIFTQVKVKVCCNKTTPKITIYPKSYSSICNGVNVARSYPPLHTPLLALSITYPYLIYSFNLIRGKLYELLLIMIYVIYTNNIFLMVDNQNRTDSNPAVI